MRVWRFVILLTPAERRFFLQACTRIYMRNGDSSGLRSLVPRQRASFNDVVGAGEQSRSNFSPSARAIFRLMTVSNFIGCSIGRSPGFAPLRTLSTY